MTGVTPDCRCAGRDQGRHGLLCENIIRGVFGDLANAPEDIKGMLRERGSVIPGATPGAPPPARIPAGRAEQPRGPGPAAPRAVWSPDETALPGTGEPGSLPAGAPVHAHQVTVRYTSASGHEIRDVVVMTDDYPLRKEDGTLDEYLDTVVRPVLKRTWYPFPADTGDRWVLPVVLRGGKYVEDPESANPLDASSVSFQAGGPVPEGRRPARPAAAGGSRPQRPGARPRRG